MQSAWGRGDPSQSTLNPNFEYLRLVVDGRVVLLALGDVEGDKQNPVEVWYSAEREVLRFQDGRLVAAVGLTTEWRSVGLPKLPTWAEIAAGPEFRWTRTRDVMPGYKFGVQDHLLITPVTPPKNSNLQAIMPTTLTWFEEVTLSSNVNDKLPPARYAFQHVDKGIVMYGEQCLDAYLCFSWQRWSASTRATAR